MRVFPGPIALLRDRSESSPRASLDLGRPFCWLDRARDAQNEMGAKLCVTKVARITSANVPKTQPVWAASEIEAIW